MTSQRNLLCAFDRNNQLVDLQWQVGQVFEDKENEDTKIETPMDQPIWNVCFANNPPFRILDFTALFESIKQGTSNTLAGTSNTLAGTSNTSLKWQFYKNIVPFARVKTPYVITEHITKVPFELTQASGDDPQNDDSYLILNLATGEPEFIPNAWDSQKEFSLRLFQVYQTFKQQLEYYLTQSEIAHLLQEFQHQERILLAVSNDIGRLTRSSY